MCLRNVQGTQKQSRNSLARVLGIGMYGVKPPRVYNHVEEHATPQRITKEDRNALLSIWTEQYPNGELFLLSAATDDHEAKICSSEFEAGRPCVFGWAFPLSSRGSVSPH